MKNLIIIIKTFVLLKTIVCNIYKTLCVTSNKNSSLRLVKYYFIII